MRERTQLIYKLENIDPEDGVDIFDIAPILMQFGELIRSANDVLGFEQKIDVRVKPFREGSWITEFVFQNQPISNLLNHLKSGNGEEMVLLLNLLGLNVTTGIQGVAAIIRFTKGIVSKFKKNEDGRTVTYESPSGERMIVSLPEHRLVQSPLIQVNYYNSVILPLEKFPNASSVNIKINEKERTEQVFTRDDKDHFEAYVRSELLEDVDENISTSNGVFLKPRRGSYSGEEKAYSFVMGENNVLWPVAILDEDFLRKLRNGEIRPYSEDVLKVNLEIIQKKDSTNKVVTQYRITEVSEYIKFEKPKQLNLDDFTDRD